MGELASLPWPKLNPTPAPPPPTCTHSNGYITKWSAFDAHNSIGKSFISVFVRTNTRTNLYIYEKEPKLKLKPETELELESMLLFLSVRCVFHCLFAGRTSTAAKLVAERMRNPFDICVYVWVCVCARDELISLGNKAPSKLDHVPNAQIAGICRGCKGHKVPPRQGTMMFWRSDVMPAIW